MWGPRGRPQLSQALSNWIVLEIVWCKYTSSYSSLELPVPNIYHTIFIIKAPYCSCFSGNQKQQSKPESSVDLIGSWNIDLDKKN